MTRETSSTAKADMTNTGLRLDANSPSLLPTRDWVIGIELANAAINTSDKRPARPHGYPVPVASKRQIFVGDVPIGGGAPVAVQTMCKTETANLVATMDQIRTVADAGADLVRVAVPRDNDVEQLTTIVKQSPIPVIVATH